MFSQLIRGNVNTKAVQNDHGMGVAQTLDSITLLFKNVRKTLSWEVVVA